MPEPNNNNTWSEICFQRLPPTDAWLVQTNFHAKRNKPVRARVLRRLLARLQKDDPSIRVVHRPEITPKLAQRFDPPVKVGSLWLRVFVSPWTPVEEVLFVAQEYLECELEEQGSGEGMHGWYCYEG